MVRTLLRIVLLVIVVAALAAFFFGYRMADRNRVDDTDHAVGTSGVSVEHAREAGAELGERVAVGATRARRVMSDAALTAKIKSKMALDDTIEAAAINVDTINGAVTLRGTVDSPAQRERAVQLARETEGVTSVDDLLSIP